MNLDISNYRAAHLGERSAQQYSEQQRKRRLFFYWHCLVCLMLNILCTADYLLNSLVVGGWLYPWLAWTVAGSLTLLLCHYLAVFRLDEEFRHRMVVVELLHWGVLDQSSSEREYGAGYLAAYNQAEKKVRAKIWFFWHAVGFGLLNGLCLLTYLVTCLGLGDWYYPWFVWSLQGTGAILLSHFFWLRLFWSDSNAALTRVR